MLESKQIEAKAKHQEIQKAFVMFKSPQYNMSSHRYKFLGEEQLKKNIEQERKERKLFNQHFDLLKVLTPNEKDKLIDDKKINRRERNKLFDQMKAI